jgi:DNA-binding protein HU-beta
MKRGWQRVVLDPDSKPSSTVLFFLPSSGHFCSEVVCGPYIAEKTNVDKKVAEAMLDCLAQLAYAHAKDEFTLPGIGKLVVIDRKARIGRNPGTGAEIQIPAKRALKFRVAKAAKDAILMAEPPPNASAASTADPAA